MVASVVEKLSFTHLYRNPDYNMIGIGSVKFRPYTKAPPKEPAGPTDCLLFFGENGQDFTLSANKEWDGTMEYSTDRISWTEWDGSAVVSVDGKLYLRGYDNTKFYTSKGARLSLSVLAGCYGNIQTLLQYDDPPAEVSENCYRQLFRGCVNLTHAPDLPAVTLNSSCYDWMFHGCANLVVAPELPATEISYSCYDHMFYGCASLTKAPELPALSVPDFAYYYMFRGCSKLVTAPNLPAISVGSDGYGYMFFGCTSLTDAPDLISTDVKNNAYEYMFYGCTGLSKAPMIYAATLDYGVCQYMFYGCTGIKLSKVQTDEYAIPYRIPVEGQGTAQSTTLGSMFTNTGGTFTGTPEINTTYYMDVSTEVQAITYNGQPVDTVICDGVTVEKIKVYGG